MKKSLSDSAMASIAAMLVLFTTILDPLISASLAVVLLLVFSYYLHKRNQKK